MRTRVLLQAMWGLLQPCPSPLLPLRPASRIRMPSKHSQATRDLESPRRARKQRSAEKRDEEAHLPFFTALAALQSSHGECPCSGRETAGSSLSRLNSHRLDYWVLSHLALGR